jgi:dTDP-4-amino-4,6-dideoxygalactose transaminase
MSGDLPALLGGSPVRPQGPPAWPPADPDVDAALAAAVANGSWGQYLGPHVPRLEALLGETLGVEHVVTCSSGTLATETALRAVGVGPGDEVILGAYEFEPSFLCVHATGAHPVLVDVSPANATILPEQIDAAISPATKAIIATHLHGGLAPMSRIVEVARQRGVRVIEDAAQASGATVEGKPAGSWGDVGVMSFGGSKLLTAGRGGALVTRHAELHQRARVILSRGIQQWGALSELQAAALVPPVQKLSARTGHREAMVRQLCESLADVPGLLPFVNDLANSRSAYYKLGFIFDEAAFGLSRDVFVKAVRAEGIAFDPGFRALHVGRAAGRYKAMGLLTHAENMGRSVVCLHHPVLSLGVAEVTEVAAAVRKTYRNATRLR